MSALRTRSLKSNFLWQFIGNGLTAFAQWLILSILTKTTTDDVTGQFVLAWALATPIFMFAALDLRVFQATDSRGEYTLGEYLLARLLSGTAAFAASLAVAAACGYAASTLAVVSAVCGIKFVELLADTFHGLLQRNERLDLVSRAMVIRALLQCLALAVGILLTRNLVTAIVGQLMVGLALLFLVEVRLSRPFMVVSRSDPRVKGDVPLLRARRAEFARAVKLIRLGLPLAFRALIGALVPNIAKYFVSAFHGLASLGVFGPISQVTLAAVMFSRSMNHAVASRLARYGQNGDFDSFRALVRKVRMLYAGLGAVTIGIALLFGKPILTMLYRADFAQYHQVFVLAMVATAIQFQGGILDLALVALRRIDSLVSLSLATLVAMLLSCACLVPRYGMDGAAVSIAVSWAVRGVFLQVLLVRALASLENTTQCSTTTLRRQAA